MRDIDAIPDLRTLIDPFLGMEYAKMDCWDFVRTLYQQGFGTAFARDTQLSAQQFQEVWFRGDARNLALVLQPWDLVITDASAVPGVSTGVGVAVDAQRFVHARQSSTGVALSRVRTWTPRILQIARWRELV
jgi:cell wall-associated NlpC family hydrolase